MQVSVIVPTYNEKENIESLMTQLLALPTRVHIIVVDDNSPDGTGESTEFTRQLDNRIRVRRLLFGKVKGSQALFTLASPHPTYQDR